MLYHHMLLLLVFFCPFIINAGKHRNVNNKNSSCVTLKGLSHVYGTRVAYALYTLSKKNFSLKKDSDYLTRLTSPEKNTLLNALQHPLQIGYAAMILLPPEIGCHIAHFIKPLSLQYKKLKPTPFEVMQHAKAFCYSPYKNGEILFDGEDRLKLMVGDKITETIASRHRLISKMMYHPLNTDEYICLENNTLCFYKKNAQFCTKWYGLSCKDIEIMPSNPSILLVSTRDKDGHLYEFDLEQKHYNDKNSSFSGVSQLACAPQTNSILATSHSAYKYIRFFKYDTGTMTAILKTNNTIGRCHFDPHNSSILAYASGRYVRIIDTRDGKQLAALTHASTVVDFNFNPHEPFNIIVTQKNGETVKWNNNTRMSLSSAIRLLKKQ